MTMTRITLRLARNPSTDFVEGDPERGYVLMAPLTDEGKIDADVYAAAKAACTVRRFGPDMDAAEGKLKRHASDWYFDYDALKTSDDEPVFKLGDHRFLPGDYITITDEDGTPLTYQVSETEQVGSL
jgi:hypothetical protein